MALKLNCLEHLTAIGIGVGACALAPFDAGLTAGAVIGGAGLFSRIRDNMRKAGLDDKAAIARMQKAILREWDHWQSTPEFRDAVTEADAAMTRLLPQLMMTREELAATATKSPDAAYPKAAAREVVDRLAMHDAMFAESAMDSPLARRFALEVIERALRAAMEDKDYATLLTLDIAVELGRAIAETLQAVNELGARIDAGFAAVQKSLGGEFERVSVQALRGAVARFIVFKPDATTSEVVAAVEEFLPQYEELRARVAALEADDNRLRGAQQAAEQALDHGDLDAARRHLAEAADIQVERLAEPVRQAAATIDELARADLLALDWQSADANWTRASEMLAPFDPTDADALAARAARALTMHGERYARAPSISAAIERWQALAASAAGRGDDAFWAGMQNDLGNALLTQGARTGGETGLALLAQAVAAFRAALGVFTEAEKPTDWARVQNNLGIALARQGERTGGAAGLALLTEAIASFDSALTVRTKDAMPLEWAVSQNNLGGPLQTKGARTSGKVGLTLLARAVEAYRAALTVHTEDAMPDDWAVAQNNLGNALQTQGTRTEGEAGLALLARAVEAFRAALTFRTQDAMPVRWAMTQNNLGTALAPQGKRTDGEAGLALLAQAIEAFHAALIVRTEGAMPAQWAMTMKNVALCHEIIADRIAAPTDELLAAEAALLDALRVYTPEHMSHYHDNATNALTRVRAKIAALES